MARQFTDTVIEDQAKGPQPVDAKAGGKGDAAVSGSAAPEPETAAPSKKRRAQELGTDHAGPDTPAESKE